MKWISLGCSIKNMKGYEFKICRETFFDFDFWASASALSLFACLSSFRRPELGCAYKMQLVGVILSWRRCWSCVDSLSFSRLSGVSRSADLCQCAKCHSAVFDSSFLVDSSSSADDECPFAYRQGGWWWRLYFSEERHKHVGVDVSCWAERTLVRIPTKARVFIFLLPPVLHLHNTPDLWGGGVICLGPILSHTHAMVISETNTGDLSEIHPVLRPISFTCVTVSLENGVFPSCFVKKGAQPSPFAELIIRHKFISYLQRQVLQCESFAAIHRAYFW